MQGKKEGPDQPQVRLLPIDIHYNKLLDWLIDRRHCTVKWPVAAQTIHAKVAAALQDMPDEEELTLLIKQSSLNYFHCQRVVEFLKVSEASTKNIFGRYSSQRMKDWQEIISLYEKDSVYLAECAQAVIHNVNFEIPGMKRQIGKSQQTHRDCERKRSEYLSNASQYRSKFRAECKKMGIAGENMKAELLRLVKELPSIYSRVCQSLDSLTEATEYYQAFVDFALGQSKRQRVWSATESCPLVRYLQHHGNTTIYQWKTGQKPEVVEEDGWLDQQLAELESKRVPSSSDVGEIDFGDSSSPVTAATTGGIVFGEADYTDVGDDRTVTAVIDSDVQLGDGFSMDAIDFSVAGDVTATTNLAEIDFGDLTMDTNGSGECDAVITVEESGTSGEALVHTARGDDAQTILACTQTRNLFIDELQELESFLCQRILEMKGEDDIVSVNLLQSASVLLQVQTADSVAAMLSDVHKVLAQLQDSRTQNLITMQTSPRYVDRLVETLQQNLQLAEKMEKQAQAMSKRQEDAVVVQRETEPKLSATITYTKELQTQLQQEISKRYNNRVVNIMGEINTL